MPKLDQLLSPSTSHSGIGIAEHKERTGGTPTGLDFGDSIGTEEELEDHSCASFHFVNCL